MPADRASILGHVLHSFAANLRDELVQALAAMTSDTADEARYHELAEKNAEGAMTPEERQELEAIVPANTLLSTLRAEARRAIVKRHA